MTLALEKVLSKINHLPTEEQDAIAFMLKEELDWQKSYSKSQKALSSLASEALAEYRKGKTQPLKFK
ncbi:MAG TPA: hypothetical protein VK809_12350 [Bacteroidia bacterium]|jgi:hypothetical protein|nr:hypothetical protein [Bacteroidia bacterium]